MSNNIKTSLITNYMKKNKMTKTVFCKKCNISYNTLKKILKNQTNFRIVALFKVAKVLKTNICDLF